MRLLLVEDDKVLGAVIRDNIASNGHGVDWVRRADDARLALSSVPYELVLLDLNLPDGLGLDLLRELRAARNPVPVIITTAQDQIAVRLEGLNSGADDYLVKPFDMSELLARIEARLRRDAPPVDAHDGLADRSVTLGSIHVDFRKAEVIKAGEKIELSGKELHLLRYFIEHQGATLSRAELLEAVWGYSTAPFTRTVDVHVANLRRKLEDDPARPAVILTIHGLGYKFLPPS